MLTDILTRSDIERLVDTFYSQVEADPLLAPLFAHIDWQYHKPIMYNFWSSMMLGDQSYSGNPLQKHQSLNLSTEHFTRWLEIFEQTVDDLFEGENSTMIKSRAQTIAGVFQFKLGITKT